METLKTGSQFDRVRKAGRTWSSGPLVLNAAPNGLPAVRCGFIVGKKVGKAVERNRARRLVREAVRLRLPNIKPGWDLVWIARSSMGQADFAGVSAAVEYLLNRGRLLAAVDPAAPGSATEAAQSRIIFEGSGAAPSPQAEQATGRG